MAINDNAVLVAAQGFVYINSVGATSPTPSEVAAFDSTTFGCQEITVTVTGTPTGGSFTLTIGGTPATIPWNATPAAVQSLVEALSTVGVGNTVVAGTALSSGITITFVQQLQGQTLTVSASGSSLTGGTTPAATATTTVAANGWVQVGHTSRGKMPEFGYSGGKLELRGSWQKERLREVRQGDPMEDSLKLTLEQWDEVSMPLYFGNDVADTPGIFGVDGLFNPILQSVFVAIVDGDETLGFYASQASIERDASIDMPIDDFAGLPIEMTFLNLGARRLYDWISESLFTT